MDHDTLLKYIEAGFTKTDLVNMGLLQEVQKPAPAPAAPAAPAAPEPKPAAPAAPEPKEQPEPADDHPGFNAAEAFAALTEKLIARVDSKIDQLQAANINNHGMDTPDQTKTVSDIITELVLPTPNN